MWLKDTVLEVDTKSSVYFVTYVIEKKTVYWINILLNAQNKNEEGKAQKAIVL